MKTKSKEPQQPVVIVQNELKIADFIKNEWKDYADYDNRRSLPHLMDGLKISQRKAMHVANRTARDKPVKVSQFVAKVAEQTAYWHGEASMNSAVVGLAQDFPGSNNYPFLQKHGQFGSRLSAEPAAPRYIHLNLHDNWDKFFNKIDQEIVDILVEEGQEIEPKFFIPVIPTLLLNGSAGIGNGFATQIMPYDVPVLVKALKEIIKHGKVKTPMMPSINGFTGKVTKIDRQVVLAGKLKILSSTKVQITELPPGYDNDKYKKLLNKLLDKKLIKDYDNNSDEDKWDWLIECPRETVARGEQDLMDLFGLYERFTENFVCWGIDTKAPLTFETPEALIEAWYVERMKLYQKSIDHQIQKTIDEIGKADLRMQFIQWCLKNDFRKLSRAELIAKTVKAIKGLTEDVAGNFSSMPIYRITTDEVAKYQGQIDKLNLHLAELKKETPIKLMEKNLNNL